MGVSNPLNSGSDPKWSFGSLPALLLWLAIKPLSGNRFWSSSSFSTKYQTLCQRFSLVGCWGKIISGWICWNSYNLLFQPLPSTIYPLSYKWGIRVKSVCRFEIQYFIIYVVRLKRFDHHHQKPFWCRFLGSTLLGIIIISGENWSQHFWHNLFTDASIRFKSITSAKNTSDPPAMINQRVSCCLFGNIAIPSNTWLVPDLWYQVLACEDMWKVAQPPRLVTSKLAAVRLSWAS